MKDQNKITEIMGTIGSAGKARGRVKIIRDISQQKDFEEGDILVANVTGPSFVPLMKKADAIVVDVGGILCHAAIVARELGKPCIVDAKIATTILKDGDLIEVDATKGIITLLNE